LEGRSWIQVALHICKKICPSSSLVVPLQINLGSMLLDTINYDETMKEKKGKKKVIFFVHLNENIK
jgi:hypothetical protein